MNDVLWHYWRIRRLYGSFVRPCLAWRIAMQRAAREGGYDNAYQ